MSKRMYLILENGTVFAGEGFGSIHETVGEVVFTTSMTGYLETLTDPSYFGQIIVQTFPLIGNYGVIPPDFESGKIFAKGYIVREWCQEPSNFRSEGDLDTFLREQGVSALCGIDVRRLTKIVRENGVMNGMISESAAADKATLDKIREYRIKDAVKSVSTGEEYISPPEIFGEGKPPKVAMLDFGAKKNIDRCLSRRGCEVHVLPANTAAERILGGGYDGVMLSNGPGDPKENVEIISQIKKLFEAKIPIFGICLGHQLLSLAAGGDTYKLKYGHRGANQPVRSTDGRVFITSQNHGYAVDEGSLPSFASVSFKNANDGTCEGCEYDGYPAFSVQFHPEACAGPLDTGFLFDRFIKVMRGEG